MQSRLARFATAAVAFALAALIGPAAFAGSNERLPARKAPSLAAANAAAALAEATEGAQLIVKFRARATLLRAAQAGKAGSAATARGPQLASALSARHGLALTDGRVIDARMQVLRGPRGTSASALAAKLAADPDVEYAVPDGRRYALALPNDPLLVANSNSSPVAGQWYLRAPDATMVSAINAVGAWDITTGSASIVVADIDTGVLLNHPDLVNKLVPGYDFIANSGIARDGDGRDADPADPGDWIEDGDCGANASDSSWHGTQTSGLIAAQTNNGVGMASVGYNVRLLPVRVLGKCGGNDSDIIAGMLWAGGVSTVPSANPNPARVLNLSLGSQGLCTAAYVDAVNRLNEAGVVVVAAAGNEAGTPVGVPANCPGVIAVAGVRHAGTKVGFSSIGPEVALSAPAGNCVNLEGACLYPILTASNAGTKQPTTHNFSDSDHPSVGTSFAAPLVSGAAALLLSVNPQLSPAQVAALLRSSARPFPTTSSDPAVQQCHAPTFDAQFECLCTTSTCGAGLLDVRAAVASASGSAGPAASIGSATSTVMLGATVTLNGAGSVAGVGRSIVGYQWAISAGGTLASFTGATNAPTAQLKVSGIGQVTITLTVTDSSGEQATSSYVLTIEAPPLPTALIAAPPPAISTGSSVTLDGSGSAAAPTLTLTSYQWELISGASRASFTSGTTGPTATLVTSGSGSGSFSVRLTVTDSLGRSSTTSRTVTISGLAPTAAFTPLNPTMRVGETLRFDSTSTAVVGRGLRSHAWALTAGAANATIVGSTSGGSVSVKAMAAGTVTLQLTVVDTSSAVGNRSTTITVLGPAGTSDADRVFDWAESVYPQFFPKPGAAGTLAPYSYRYYAATGTYLGTANGRVVLHNGRDWNMLDVGALADFLQQATAAGF